MADYDVIIIGGNTPALTTAAYLGKMAGLKTLIVERSNFIGASAMTVEMRPGYKFHPAATGEYYVHPKLEHDLELSKYGLERVHCSPTLTTSFGDGNYLSLYYEVEKTQAEIARFSEKDADTYGKWIQNYLKIGQLFGMAQVNEAPSWPQFIGAMSGSQEMQVLMRDMLFGSAQDCLDNAFENDYVKASFLTLMEGGFSGPSDISFWFNIARILSPWGFVKGGLVKVAESLEACALDNGTTIKRNAEVVKILTRNGEAYGIRTKDGEEITAKYAVVSELEWPKVFNEMIDDVDLPADFTKGLKEIKYQCGGVTLNVALDKMPNFGFPEDRFGGFFGITKPGFDYAEEAFAAYKCKKLPAHMMSMTYMPTYYEEPGTFAPVGHHVLTGYAFPVNHIIDKPWKQGGKEMLLERWIDSLDEFAPGLKDSVIFADGYDPSELEEKFGMTNGDLGHGTLRWYGELANRPIPGYSKYRVPVKNLYMGGQNVHPLSGLGGVGGFNVAMAIMKDKGFIEK